MKKRLILIFISFVYISASSSDNIPLLISGAMWSVITTDESFSPEHPQPTQYTTWYKISGDSIIDGESYKVVVSSTDSSTIAWKISFLAREDNGKVYQYLDETLKEELLYDFNLNVQDSIYKTIHGTLTQVSKVISKKDTTINGISRKKMVLDIYLLEYPEIFYKETWIEGIGSLLGLRRESCGLIIGCYISHELSSYYANNELIYQSNNTLVETTGKHWDLFVPGRNSYYKQQVGQSATVENFLLDSVLVLDEMEVLYFNRKPSFKPECYQAIRNEPYFDGFLNPNKIDSLIRLNDSILFIDGYSASPDTFIFKPLAKVNESWITNGITIKCEESGVMNIFGNQDSIKRFTCHGKNYDGIEFILSKSHGFIKFLPLDEFFYHPYNTQFPPYFELAGFSYKDISVGYTQPDFSDYFKLSPGDILYWREIYAPNDPIISGSIKYRRDSITHTFISADSVHYNFKSVLYDKVGNVLHSGESSSYHLRKNEGLILDNHTSWYGLKYCDYQPPYEIFLFESLNLIIENDDTITQACYALPGWYINTSDCEIGYIADYDFRACYNTREGLVSQASYSWGESSTTLMGSVINGVEYGDTDIPTGINHNSLQEYYVYPNPFIDYIHIDSQKAIDFIRIYDFAGKVIKELSHNFDRLFLGDIRPGIYILEIIDAKKNVKRIKLIKQ